MVEFWVIIGQFDRPPWKPELATYKVGYFILDLGIINLLLNTLLIVMCCSLGILLGICVGVIINLETGKNMELLNAHVSDFELSMVRKTTQDIVQIMDLWTPINL